MKTSILATAILTTLAAVPAANAFEAGDLILRGGVTVVAPDDSTSNIVIGDADSGVGLSVDNDTQLGINLAYFLTDRINLELLAATPFKHDVNFNTADPLGTGDQVGEVKHLPPTLTVNYYFNDVNSAFQPYVGIGVNYTIFFDEEFTAANDEAGLADLDLDDSFGLSAQIGADYMLNDKWFINGSVRWIDIDTEANFNVGGANSYVDDIQIDPWVYTVSLGYKF